MMKKRSPVPSKHLEDLMSLIYQAEINFFVCEKIYSVFQAMPQANQFFLLSANNAFCNSVSLLHTLLCSNKVEEIRIEPVLQEIIERDREYAPSISDEKIDQFIQSIRNDYPNPNFWNYEFLSTDDGCLIGDIMKDIKKKKRVQGGLEELKKIRTTFEKAHFHKIRHQLVAHKNKYLEIPGTPPRLYLQDKYLNSLKEIIKELRIQAFIWFDYELRNPYQQVLIDLEDCFNNRHLV